MTINACDRCGKIYVANQNNKFTQNGIVGCNVVKRSYMAMDGSDAIIPYDLCDKCCEDLFEFLETSTDFAVNGRSMEDMWK